MLLAKHFMLFEPRWRPAFADFDIDPEFGKIGLGIVYLLTVTEVAVECVSELPESLDLRVAEGGDTGLNVPSRHAAVILMDELNVSRRIGVAVRYSCHTISKEAK